MLSGVPDNRGIFLSYRHEDADDIADRIADLIGPDRVLMDVDGIEPGRDFAEAIAEVVQSSALVLVLIGPRWLTATDPRGRRRIEDPDDTVALQIEAALRRGVRVVPVLLDDARMPARDELPLTLQPLSRRQAVHVKNASFVPDVERLLHAIDRILEAAPQPDRVPTADRSPQRRQRLTVARAQELMSALPPVDVDRWYRDRAADDVLFGSDEIAG